MTFPVKSFQSSQMGAPQLSQLPGSLIAVLDACLINGFNLQALDSLRCSDGLATATVSAGHGFQVNDMVLIAGAEPAWLNGEQRISAASNTSFEFPVAERTPVSASGSVSARIAPIGGWEKLHAASGRAVYRSTRIQSNRLCLLVDDSEAYRANVWLCETMADLSTASNPAPSALTVKRLRWRKCSQSETGPRVWALVGDAMLFFLLPRIHSAYGRGLMAFGDIQSYRPGDAYATILFGEDNPGDTAIHYPNDLHDALHCSGATTGQFIARPAVQLGGAVNVGKLSLATAGANPVLSGYQTGLSFPNLADYALLLHPVYLKDNLCLRGQLPGYFCVHQDQPLGDAVTIGQVAGFPDRRFLLYAVGYGSNGSGRVAFDLTGPWR